MRQLEYLKHGKFMTVMYDLMLRLCNIFQTRLYGKRLILWNNRKWSYNYREISAGMKGK